jgi:hypothetical protein
MRANQRIQPTASQRLKRVPLGGLTATGEREG